MSETKYKTVTEIEIETYYMIVTGYLIEPYMVASIIIIE